MTGFCCQENKKCSDMRSSVRLHCSKSCIPPLQNFPSCVEEEARAAKLFPLPGIASICMTIGFSRPDCRRLFSVAPCRDDFWNTPRYEKRRDCIRCCTHWCRIRAKKTIFQQMKKGCHGWISLHFIQFDSGYTWPMKCLLNTWMKRGLIMVNCQVDWEKLRHHLVMD